MTATFKDGMSSAAYHAHAALGSTSLKTLASRTPAHYKYESEHATHKDAYDLGTAIHSITLEGDETGIAGVDADSWRTKAAQEAKAEARATGRVPMLLKDLNLARNISRAIMSHPPAAKLLTGHIAERSVFWEEDGLQLKCRPDALNHDKIIDLKSTINADPRNFGKTAVDFGYFQSAAHYQDGMERLTGDRLPFLFILAEKSAPYLVSVVELDEEAIEYGRLMNTRAKNIYRECIETGTWPGYPETEQISLPMWSIYQMNDLLGIESDMELKL